ncbi:MAG: UDP-glucose 4-epimerase GalE [Lactobacillales bacterium]|jgi:UDP-glucose 4-epimerase|nr:UDP-glucose 4-epimerase GalE [Lactobacillales bacterium]
MKNILVTGGAGYIGSHTLVALIEEGYRPIVFDNFSNSSAVAIKRVEEITGVEVEVIKGDITRDEDLDLLFNAFEFSGVIHFAGLKAVGESEREPLKYWVNNVDGSIKLFAAMKRFDVKNIIFSSSATVYGDRNPFPYKEGMPLGAVPVYGKTKEVIEYALMNLKADGFNSLALRYFNPVGSHKSGKIGENPQGIPNNLAPFITQTLVGKREKLTVFGNDYNTPDGTNIRDYIHVLDLARAHVVALNYLLENEIGFDAINIGSAKGYSNLEVIEAFEKAAGTKVNWEFGPRRAGDLDEYFADATKAKEVLGFEVEYDIEEMAADAWKWQRLNPNGFEEVE